ncbi:MAG: hypothetical protein WCG05_01360 [Alphaproteobacteria bacterium]
MKKISILLILLFSYSQSYGAAAEDDKENGWWPTISRFFNAVYSRNEEPKKIQESWPLRISEMLKIQPGTSDFELFEKACAAIPIRSQKWIEKTIIKESKNLPQDPSQKAVVIDLLAIVYSRSTPWDERAESDILDLGRTALQILKTTGTNQKIFIGRLKKHLDPEFLPSEKALVIELASCFDQIPESLYDGVLTHLQSYSGSKIETWTMLLEFKESDLDFQKLSDLLQDLETDDPDSWEKPSQISKAIKKSLRNP